MDRQLFPSLLIATATQRPAEDEEEAKEPDPYLLGDQFGLVGVSIKAPKANAQMTITLKRRGRRRLKFEYESGDFRRNDTGAKNETAYTTQE